MNKWAWLDEKSKVYRFVSNALALLALVFIVMVFLSLNRGYDLLAVGLWGWVMTFGGFLLHKGVSELVVKKKRDGLLYVVLPIIFLIFVIWYTVQYS